MIMETKPFEIQFALLSQFQVFGEEESTKIKIKSIQ